jgi:hypothetical protein
MDIYSTDAKIARYGLRVLTDDRGFFPEYAAVLLYRNDLPQRLPKTWAALTQLEGRIPAERMIAMNAAAELEGKPFAGHRRRVSWRRRGARQCAPELSWACCSQPTSGRSRCNTCCSCSRRSP